eukprot:SAG25_NODE_335_length_9565_cov_55.989858_1_plen_97_part_00
MTGTQRVRNVEKLRRLHRIGSAYKQYWHNQASEPDFQMMDPECHQEKDLGDDCHRLVLSYGVRDATQRQYNDWFILPVTVTPERVVFDWHNGTRVS